MTPADPRPVVACPVVRCEWTSADASQACPVHNAGTVVLLTGTPIDEYRAELTEADYAVIARTLDENRADRARREADARREERGD
jgi:hypothetical protein